MSGCLKKIIQEFSVLFVQHMRSNHILFLGVFQMWRPIETTICLQCSKTRVL